MLGVSPWLDATALEGRLKTACRSPRILHLATHGFFLPDEERDLNREGRGVGFDFGEFSGAKDGPDRLSGPMMENPMLRSGLALAGANTWLKAGNPPEEAEDGLLTAEDVTGLDLLATELVVLSACETGLGQIHVGEGRLRPAPSVRAGGGQNAGHELMEGARRADSGADGGLLPPPAGRRGPGRGPAAGAARAEGQVPRTRIYWGAFICQGDPSPLGTASPGATSPGIANDRLTG